MITNMLRRIEDLLVQVVRVVLLVFSLLVLVGMALWTWESFRPGKAEAPQAVAQELNWKDARPDLQFVVDETSRDLGAGGGEPAMEKRLADPALRPAFQKADALVRAYVNKDPARRERTERDNQARGLAPLHPLLQGDALPSEADVQRRIQERGQREGDAGAVDAAADAAAAAAASTGEEDGWMVEPVDTAAAIHERAQAAELEHGKGAYAAYVQGLPAALEQVFGNAALEPRLQAQTAQQILSTVLLNYTLSLDNAARALRGEDSHGSSSWKERFGAVETAFWSMLMSFLVLVVMVLVFIRMERHLRVISQQHGQAPRQP
ncbi:hypothetical protein BO996_01215 [Delftia sp. HK171]|uniref:Uncharacterized protein n=2 Tax=Delftia acidovorans TaxID=80866 RepID=A9BR37_DELAS|nr:MULTISPECIES: hypothetical protein [Delftia]MCP4016651.1 hypothetical protein [Delftia sp.]OLE92309.1 MAG: hypothetical protein AUI84_20800 [Delftia sp. 13_1_40CM_3_66_6]ABX32992.1 hypothetical protein Daci_0346 [Delftia acidovorans SPH-1]APE46567.1 hypothetical protein BO996_01215 [Delftia sp. HK171]MBN9322124.1 hypothetical protein [Delftia acidovorans]